MESLGRGVRVLCGRRLGERVMGIAKGLLPDGFPYKASDVNLVQVDGGQGAPRAARQMRCVCACWLSSGWDQHDFTRGLVL